MMMLVANMNDIADAVSNAIAARDAIIGWANENMNIVNIVRTAHNDAKIVRGNLNIAR